MADVRELFTQHFDAARSAASHEDQTAAAESLRSAVLVARSDPHLQRELASALLHLGKLEEKLGRKAEAEELLTEALGLSERLFGMDHPSLAPLLNELSRLHIQQSHHARAEAALERLLAIARTKGDEHADVATALAGIAFVKRRTGDDSAAEALYRDALHIREKVLAPNHMVTVVTLEQLSETCAARGKVDDALSLLRRALPTREAALGADHATVSAARSRIAALEAQLHVAAPAGDPNELVFLYKPEAKKRRPVAPPRQLTPALSFTAALAAAPSKAAKAQPKPPAPAAPVAMPTRESILAPAPAPAPAPVVARTSSPVHRDVVRAAEADRAVARADVAPAPVHSHKGSPGKRPMLYASAGVAAVAIIAGGLTLRSRGGDSRDRVDAQVGAAAPAPVMRVGAATNGHARNEKMASGDAAHVELQGSALPVTPAAAAPVAPANTPSVRPEQRAPEIPAFPPEPTAPRVGPDLGRVNLSTIASVNVDSMVRSSTKLERDYRGDQLGAGVSRSVQIGAVSAAAKSTDADEPIAIRPKIIGRMPAPRYPESLRARWPEAEVIVRFQVDEHGRVDVGGMTVIKSDHELFTAAVRDIMPLLHFEPARLPAPDSKPVAVWVDLPFKFSAKR